MRVKLSIGDVEIRVQERRVVMATAFSDGKKIAEDVAICAPGDEFDSQAGANIAVERLAQKLVMLQESHAEAAQESIVQALTKAKALKAQITLPAVVPYWEIWKQVTTKLAAKREKDLMVKVSAEYERAHGEGPWPWNIKQ